MHQVYARIAEEQGIPLDSCPHGCRNFALTALAGDYRRLIQAGLSCCITPLAKSFLVGPLNLCTVSRFDMTLAHEHRHATQYARCIELLNPPVVDVLLIVQQKVCWLAQTPKELAWRLLNYRNPDVDLSLVPAEGHTRCWCWCLC